MDSNFDNSKDGLEEKIKFIKEELNSGKISEAEFQKQKEEILSGAFASLEPKEKVDPSEIFISERIKKEWQVLSKDTLHFWIPLILVLSISIPIVYYWTTSLLEP